MRRRHEGSRARAGERCKKGEIVCITAVLVVESF